MSRAHMSPGPYDPVWARVHMDPGPGPAMVAAEYSQPAQPPTNVCRDKIFRKGTPLTPIKFGPLDPEEDHFGPKSIKHDVR